MLKFETTPDIAKAATLAFIQEAHSGQKYGEMPYFFHPIEVASQIPSPSIEEFLAALLHDVIEDTKYTEAELRERFSDEVVDMVVLLTKDKTLSYEANIQRIINSGNVGAMRVKLADNQVNLAGDKSDMSAERAARLTKKYTKSIQMLETALNEIFIKTWGLYSK